MKKYTYRIIKSNLGLILLLISFISGQAQIDTEAVKKIEQIQLAICEKDNECAQKLLEEFEGEFPNDGMILLTNKLLSELYLRDNRTELAIEKLLHAINYKAITRQFNRDSTDCDKKFYKRIHKSDLCVSLSNIYLNIGKHDACLYYLELAQTKYNPNKGCGNGLRMYNSYLSTYFADCFLEMGDTSKAIERLFNHIIMRESNEKLLGEKLKVILLEKYSNECIQDEIMGGIENMVIILGKEGEPKRLILLEMFGCKIYKNAREFDLEYWRKRLQKNIGLKQFLE